MTTLIVGFDAAWTEKNSGALVGVLSDKNGIFDEICLPLVVDFRRAESTILEWQERYRPESTIVFIDQPTIVKNEGGQRPVDNLASSPVSLRYGGMQPANTSKKAMFGEDAPVWRFLNLFGGPADLLEPLAGTCVVETYPVLAMIALDWMLPDVRHAGRLPKYNPVRKKTFSLTDWRHVCQLTLDEFKNRGLQQLSGWLDDAARISSPRKRDQDGVDACICLLAALYLAERRDCLMVGDQDTGYIVVPHGDGLFRELLTRCERTGRVPSEWVRSFQLQTAA